VHHAKLTDVTVWNLRAIKVYCPKATYDKLEALYGVDRNAIHKAVVGKTWKHVPFPRGAWL
jgi:hypothetical protein